MTLLRSLCLRGASAVGGKNYGDDPSVGDGAVVRVGRLMFGEMYSPPAICARFMSRLPWQIVFVETQWAGARAGSVRLKP